MNYQNRHKIVSGIIVPVKLDQEYIRMLKQVAEIAREHHATVYLLYVEPVSFTLRKSWASQLPNQRSLQARLKEKHVLMTTWKRWLEHEYGISATCTVDWGNWKKMTLRYAKMFHADMIVLSDQYYTKSWFAGFITSPPEYIIKKSNCQVITVFSKKDSIAQWTQIVISVTGFIPVARILTIIKSARAFNIKIHLISSSANETDRASREFHFLTESLKFLKNYGNVQVECRFVSNNMFPFTEYMKYAKSIGADALMTNNHGQVSVDPVAGPGKPANVLHQLL